MAKNCKESQGQSESLHSLASHLIFISVYQFLPRDALQSAVMLWWVVCLSVCDVGVLWPYFEFLGNNYIKVSLASCCVSFRQHGFLVLLYIRFIFCVLSEPVARLQRGTWIL